MKIWCTKILSMKKYTEKLADGRNVLKDGYGITALSAYGSFISGEAIDKFAEYEEDKELQEMQKSKQFVFRNVRCWLATEWIYQSSYHFNFAPLGYDYVDDKGNNYFIHCTYEPTEKNEYWFSYWYDDECYEPTLEELTEKEREYIKNAIQHWVYEEKEIEQIAENLEWISDTEEPCDNQGYEYYVECRYLGKTYMVYISMQSNVSDIMQGAKQVYEVIHGIYKKQTDTGKLNFEQCIWLLHDCIKQGILQLDPNNENNMLVYRLAGENSPEGWYSENIHKIARELCEDYKGQHILRLKLEKRKNMQ